MGDGSMIRFAWVLAIGGLAGVLASARGVGQAVQPPGTVARLPQNAAGAPKSVAKTPKKLNERPRKAAKGPKMVTNSIGMHFVLVPAGEFLMGSPTWDKDGQPDERPQHTVRITRPFFLGACEVTQQEYQRVMGVNPSSEQLSPQQPVETVSWFDAVQFCNRLSEREKVSAYYEISGERVTILGGNGYRLPTEAEWEYACRARSNTKWSCGDDVQQLELYAWYKGNAGSHSHPVGEKAPNAFGLYDMHGHMWEWCWDRYGEDYYRHSPVDDPQGPSSGSLRIERGGDGWNNDPPHLRSAYRDHQVPSLRFRDLGFRVARTSNEPPLEPIVEDDGKEDSPTQTLKKRGLVRLRGTPSTWVLREETAVLDRLRLAQAQQARLNWGREQQPKLAEGSQSRQAFIAALQAQLNGLEAQMTEIDRKLAENPFVGQGMAAYYHNLLVQQHNAMVGEERSLNTIINSFYQQGGDFQEQLRRFGKEIETMEKSCRQTVEELRDSVAEINKRYEELGSDQEVAKALSELSAKIKANQRLGPSRELKEATKALTRPANSNRAGAPAQHVRKKK
jgi:formylglycine-generating enzyme required for sulfatase activity